MKGTRDLLSLDRFCLLCAVILSAVASKENSTGQNRAEHSLAQSGLVFDNVNETERQGDLRGVLNFH